jgi:hypothetical protein
MKMIVPKIGGMSVEPGNDGALYPNQCWTSGDQTDGGI